MGAEINMVGVRLDVLVAALEEYPKSPGYSTHCIMANRVDPRDVAMRLASRRIKYLVDVNTMTAHLYRVLTMKHKPLPGERATRLARNVVAWWADEPEARPLAGEDDLSEYWQVLDWSITSGLKAGVSVFTTAMPPEARFVDEDHIRVYLLIQRAVCFYTSKAR